MLKRSLGLLSKAKGAGYLPFNQLKAIAPLCLLNKVPQSNFSSAWNNIIHQTKSLNTVTKFSFASLPSHTKLPMPALSPTMEQGNIAKWNFKEGDKVDVGDLICDIETDKATLGFEMQDAGYIAKILVPEGTKGVKVGTPIVILVENQADVKGFADYKSETGGQPQAQATPKQAEPKEQKTTQAQPQKQQTSSGHEHHSENFKGVPRSNVLIRFARGHHGEEGHTTGADGRVFASPLARKIARERNIDLSQVQGTGPHGRIVKADVESYTPKAAPTQAETKPEQKVQKAQTPVAGAAPSSQYTDIPLTSVREIIAKRLLESKTTIPHYYIRSEIVMDDCIAMREKINKEAKSKVSFNDIFVKAAALACVEVPEVNSQWHDKFIRKFKNVDVSIAVDTGSSLITPIVFAANTKGLGQIAANTKELIEKAKSNTLKPQEFQGGTFGLSNLGMFGSVNNFSAVINPPHASMLAIGKTEKKVVPDGNGFKEVSVLKVTLSSDHRVVDGAVAARWLQIFKAYLEKPHTMLL